MDVTNFTTMPVKADDQSLDDYLADIKAYCVDFHTEQKRFFADYVQDSVKGEYLEKLVHNSNEPQYKLYRMIGNWESMNHKDKVEYAFKVFEQIQRLKDFADKRKFQKEIDIELQFWTEVHYLSGMKAKEIYEQLKKTYTFNEINEDNHMRRIYRYIKNFKHEGDFDNFKDLAFEDKKNRWFD
jgi:hypothetical protein